VIRDLYPTGWSEDSRLCSGRGVTMEDDAGEQLVTVSMGISTTSIGANVDIHQGASLALSRRIADAMAAAALAVVTAYRAGNVADVEADMPIPYAVTSPAEAAAQ
jgi:hypothetical protein